MPKLHDLDFDDWNSISAALHAESDRGAAVLAAGFVENYLGLFLRSKVVDKKIGASLFDAMGPLASFSQRIVLARAFGFIPAEFFEDLTRIRKMRNLFAHHPLHTTFSSNEIGQLAFELSTYTMVAGIQKPGGETNRTAYLLACTRACGTFSGEMRASEP